MGDGGPLSVREVSGTSFQVGGTATEAGSTTNADSTRAADAEKLLAKLKQEARQISKY